MIKARVFKDWLFDKKLYHDRDVDSFLASEPCSMYSGTRVTVAGSKAGAI